MNSAIVQNGDIIHHVLSFLGNDGTSVARFSLCSKELHDQILQQHENFYPNLWKVLIYHRYRWKRTRRSWPALSSSNNRSEDDTKSNDNNVTTPMSYRDLYIEKRRADAEAIRQLKEMASALQSVLQSNDDAQQKNILDDANPLISQAWDHHSWKSLLEKRVDYYDIMKTTARRYCYYFDKKNTSTLSSLSIHDKLFGFLAASCVQDFHFADCLWEWKQLLTTETNGSDEPQSQTRESQLEAAYLLERYSLLVCEIQKTPLELLQDDGSPLNNCCTGNIQEEHGFETNQKSTKTFPATTYLDEIARVCRNRIHEELDANPSVTAKLDVVNKVLVTDYGFSGNSKDYYNYRNVLLDHVLESKTGMPITLCVIYSCVCRRLGIAVQLTGLPGHIVLGFDTTDDDETTTAVTTERRRLFIDVFHECRILSSDDCRQIVTSYGIGWRDDFLTPLSTKMTLHRIFNNLRNCHEKAMGTGRRSERQQLPLFSSELVFQQNTLGMVHCYPAEIGVTLLERLIQDLSIVLSPDLLRVYNLLSPRGLGIDVVVNATPA